MLITQHPNSDALTLTTYHDGVVTIKTTDASSLTGLPFVDTMPLATFLRNIGIPFKAVRAITSGEDSAVA